MSTIHQLETILERLKRCPLNLVRVELEMFLNTLKSDVNLITPIMEIINSNQEALGAKASTLVTNIGSSSWADLGFANSAPLRAVVGYQLCECLLSERHPFKCGKNIVQIGNYYGSYQGKSGQLHPSDAISVFSEVFLDPLVSYLHNAVELRHRILMLLSRYKQRGEWFSDNTKVNAILKNKTGNIENALKMDFLLYLFDNGIDFSIESESPPGGGEVDVLVVLPELGPLPIEVKVFDGAKRNASYVSGGLAQSCEYARKFNSSEAYYIVYNVAENKIPLIPGISSGPNVVSTQLMSITIHSIIVNLCMTIPASRAKSLKSVNVQLPTLK
jgi:hypothetical protein